MHYQKTVLQAAELDAWWQTHLSELPRAGLMFVIIHGCICTIPTVLPRCYFLGRKMSSMQFLIELTGADGLGLSLVEDPTVPRSSCAFLRNGNVG